AQAVGRIPVAFKSWAGVVFMATGRKALMGPMGAGFMAAPSLLLDGVEPLIASPRSSHLSYSDRAIAQRLLYSTGPGRHEGNLPDLAALAGLRAVVEREADDNDEWRKRVCETASTFVDTLR